MCPYRCTETRYLSPICGRYCARTSKSFAGEASLKAYGLQSTQTAVLLRRVRQLLGYESFFTVGPLTAHGWSFRTGATARQAAGVIHTDFEKHFLRARVLQWSEFVTSSTLDHAERRMRAVDAPHIMTDGDVFVCDHNAPRRD